MSFPRYPTYKSSGVDWLGDVPAHWDVQRLKALFELQNRVPLEGDGIVTAFRDGQVTLRINRRTEGFTNAVQEAGYQRVQKGDLVIHAMDAFAGAIGISDSDGKSTPVYSVCTPRHPAVHVPYFGRLLRHIALSGYITALAKGIRERSTEFRWNEASNVRVAVPGDREQEAIAAFLDRETAKIDALVAEQERLIELLKEKRQVVISHAVTKGLNPDAPMKDSGIEWLGQVPAHWEILKGARIGVLFGSEQVPEESVVTEGALPFIKVASLSATSFEVEGWDWFVDPRVAADYRPRSDFLVFPKRGAAIFLNKVNVVTRPSLIDPNLMGWVIGPRAMSAFMAFALKTRKLEELADVSTVPQINNKHIAPEPFAIPPLDEQRLIVSFLQVETAKIDGLIAEASQSIGLLQERRTALISAAVTGQIDVRPESMRTAA